MALKDLRVSIGADTSGFSRGVKDVQKGVKNVKSGVGGMGKSLSILRLKAVAVTASITAMTAASVKLMKAYAGLRNSVQRTNELFRESNKYIEYFANNTARAFGMSETTAYQYAMTYGNLFKGITKSTEENAKVTIAMMKASAVIASKTGRTMEDVNERIRSGILGNTEAIEDLGINVPIAMIKTTKAFKQIADGRSWESLTYQEQQQIRVLAILEQSTSQYGDSVSQISGMSLPRLGQAFKDLMSYAGMFVTKALQPIINALGMIVHAATAALKSLSNMLGWDLAGGVKPAAEAIQDGAVGFGDMSDDAKNTSKAVKEIRKNLMGFDELNVLAPPDTSSGDTTGLGGVGSSTAFDGLAMPEFVELPDLNADKMTKSFDKIKSKVKDVAKELTKKFAPSITALSDLWKGIQSPARKAFDSVTDTIKGTWNETLKPFASYVLGDFIPSISNDFTTTFAPIFKDYLSTVMEQFALDFEFVCRQVDTIIFDVLQPAMERVKTVAGDAFGSIKESWDIYGESILQGFADFKENLREIWDNLYENIIQPVIESIGKKFDWLWDKHLKQLWDNVVKFIMSVGEFLLALWNNVLVPHIDFLVKVFGPIFKAVFNIIADVVGTVIATISDILGGLIKIAKGVIEFLTGVFTGDWQKAWDGIEEIMVGIVDTIAGLFKGMVNLIIDAINGLIGAVWAGVQAIIGGVGTVVSKFGQLIGQDWDISIPGEPPAIPKLARGGLATAPTLAVVGDNKNARIDPEVIAPLSKLEDMIGNKIMQAMQFSQMQPAGAGGYGGDITVQCILDDREIGRAVVKYQNRQMIKGGR